MKRAARFKTGSVVFDRRRQDLELPPMGEREAAFKADWNSLTVSDKGSSKTSGTITLAIGSSTNLD